MKALKNRKIAVVIAVCVMVFATLFAVPKSLNGLARDIEDMFYSGVYLEDEGYRETSIHSHLTKAVESSLGLVSITKSYPELADKSESLSAARRALLDSKTITDRGKANYEMVLAYYELLHAAELLDMSERDAEAMRQYRETFSGAENAITRSRYNEKVKEFHSGYSVIADMLAILPVNAPESFINPDIPR